MPLLPREHLRAFWPPAPDILLTLVRAPAGFGKTCLLRDWYARAGQNAAWITLDANSSLAWTDHHAAYLFLDAAGAQTDQAAIALLTDFLANPPENPPHIVLALRELPPLPLGRLRALGRLVELGPQDLVFRFAETCALLTCFAAIDQPRMSALHEATQGWAAGLILAGQMIARGQSPEIWSNIAEFGAWAAVGDFLEQDVLRGIDADLRQFLVEISCVERFCVALCAHVTQHDQAAQMLRRAENAGLFIEPLDLTHEWYRLHPVFRTYLRHHLATHDTAILSAVHLRASNWFATHGQAALAFHHAMSGQDPALASGILESSADTLFADGKENDLLDLAESVPHEVQSHYPRMILAIAFRRAVQRQFERTRILLDTVAGLTIHQATGAEARHVRLTLMHREMIFNLFRNETKNIESCCLMLMREFPDASAMLKGSLYTSMVYARRDHFRIDRLDSLNASAREFYARVNSEYSLIFHIAALGPALFMAGRTDDAIACLQSGLDCALRVAGSEAAMASMVAVPLSEIAYEQNRLEEAEMLLDAHAHGSRSLGYADQLRAGWITRCRLLRTRGHLGDAERILQEAMAFADEKDFLDLGLYIAAEQMELCLLDGRLKQASRIAHRLHLHDAARSVLPGPASRTADAARALVWVRHAQIHERLGDATAVARQWRNHTTSAGAVRPAVGWGVVLAQLLLLAGDERAAQRSLRQALALAEPAGLFRSLLDHGKIIETLLNRPSDTSTGISIPLQPGDQLAFRLLAALSGKPVSASHDLAMPVEAPPVELLNSQEIRILSLAAVGLSNRDIGQAIGTTEGSIKWYLQQIFNKVGTRRRFAAIERARRLGLI